MTEKEQMTTALPQGGSVSEESVATILKLPSQPFKSLPALRRAHNALLRRQRSENASERPTPEDLARFMKRVQDSGRNLADTEARSTAQGFLDYWYGALVLSSRKNANPIDPLDLDDYEPSTGAGEPGLSHDGESPANPDESADPREFEGEASARLCAELAAKARDYSKGLPVSGRRELRGVLQHLIRLSDSGQLELSQLPLKDEFALTPEPATLLAGLAEAGILQQESTASGESQAYVLAHHCLLKDWPELKAAADRRRSLREMTSAWLKSGRKKEALLPNGDLLDSAADYSDLNAPEREFVRNSQQYGSQQRLGKISLLSTICIALAVMSFSLYKKNGELEQNNFKLKDSQSDLRKQRDRARAAT